MTVDGLLARLLDSVPEEADLESMTRPMLELLEAVTGFESTYLTFIDFERGEQTVGFAHNVAELTIPEALTVPWDDTLCKRALDEGQAIYAKYGDDAAKPRIARTLRRERRTATGSRTGFVGNLTIIAPGPDGSYQSIDGSKYYDERYWDPEQYQAWHDSIWMRPRIGLVRVGEIEPASKVDSRVPPTPSQVDAEEPHTPEPDPVEGPARR